MGGGIAGLWALRRLTAAGYNAVLFEADKLGSGQTLASQGMIHGGLKYALGGNLTGASEAIAGMPARWRACLAGSGEIDLSGVTPLSDTYYLFAGRSALGKLATFFASKSLRGRIDRLTRREFPPAFAGFDGNMYALADLVVDVPQLLQELSTPVSGRIYRARIDGSNCTAREQGFELALGGHSLHVRTLVCCAGPGAETLQQDLGVEPITMQRRPLRQVLVQQPMAHPLYAHCLTNISRPEPRLTITTHGDTLYLGGRIATEGVERDDAEQIAHARRELAECLPWMDFSQARISTLYVDRAEPRQASRLRPDEAFVERRGDFIQCWPTKLTLAPDAADRILGLLPPPHTESQTPSLDLPVAPVGKLPWT